MFLVVEVLDIVVEEGKKILQQSLRVPAQSWRVVEQDGKRVAKRRSIVSVQTDRCSKKTGFETTANLNHGHNFFHSL